ncbi:hypothetical protein [Priestia flexa]|uniref:hypothetical protein n=1 Tax=Priestia flexa TaxID=86664 RepID=UPI000A6E0596|nr:hypothetical protein [Priestia flexa]
MKHVEQRTIHIYEISDVNRLILIGLLSKVLKNESLELDKEANFKIAEILEGLVNKSNN